MNRARKIGSAIAAASAIILAASLGSLPAHAADYEEYLYHDEATYTVAKPSVEFETRKSWVLTSAPTYAQSLYDHVYRTALFGVSYIRPAIGDAFSNRDSITFAPKVSHGRTLVFLFRQPDTAGVASVSVTPPYRGSPGRLACVVTGTYDYGCIIDEYGHLVIDSVSSFD